MIEYGYLCENKHNSYDSVIAEYVRFFENHPNQIKSKVVVYWNIGDHRSIVFWDSYESFLEKNVEKQKNRKITKLFSN